MRVSKRPDPLEVVRTRLPTFAHIFTEGLELFLHELAGSQHRPVGEIAHPVAEELWQRKPPSAREDYFCLLRIDIWLAPIAGQAPLPEDRRPIAFPGRFPVGAETQHLNASACLFGSTQRFRVATEAIFLRILAKMRTHRVQVDIGRHCL